ncbi:hypothetical protein [Pleionea sp. CnH1-48]|uniref:hypothetical protein n=1 Tax=Pleionea sp. CnH1-48 TaxID=2954494 RepID=UPI0020975882|nr:hypothetical protein [Pleionea sp. CnH1-48]MCO7224404.1 hypothetical protein [Pleionea sp. CnH1-48]
MSRLKEFSTVERLQANLRSKTPVNSLGELMFNLVHLNYSDSQLIFNCLDKACKRLNLAPFFLIIGFLSLDCYRIIVYGAKQLSPSTIAGKTELFV